MSVIPATCPELGIEVAVSKIDHELRKLWEQDEARSNASLMNFVVYSEHPGDLLANSQIIRQLTREHACRAILVEVDRNEDTSLRAWITAHCHLSHGKKSVCCEQISFRLTGRVTGRFRNTVFAHLNSDLPLVFWWQGELTDVFSERLVSVIDRLIVDSSRWADSAESFLKITEASEANPGLVVQDLAWTRCWQYRVGIASLFDDAVAQKALADVDSISIHHHPAQRNTGLLTASWLIVQAGWKRLNDQSWETKEGRPIAINIESDESSAPLGLVEIRGGSSVVRVSQEKGSCHVLREIISGEYHVSSLSPCDPDDPAELVALQLARGGKNSLFKKILPTFRQML